MEGHAFVSIPGLTFDSLEEISKELLAQKAKENPGLTLKELIWISVNKLDKPAPTGHCEPITPWPRR
jgi:hypothetical protein